MHDWHWNLKGYLKLSVYDDETNLQEIADCIEAAIHSNWKPDVLDVEILTTDTMKNFIAKGGNVFFAISQAANQNVKLFTKMFKVVLRKLQLA